MEVLASKTGYDTEMIEDDMELETELGIYSIKRVEILSEVQKQLSVEAQDVAALSRTQTVGEVVDAMLKESASAGSSATSGGPRGPARQQERVLPARLCRCAPTPTLLLRPPERRARGPRYLGTADDMTRRLSSRE